MSYSAICTCADFDCRAPYHIGKTPSGERACKNCRCVLKNEYVSPADEIAAARELLFSAVCQFGAYVDADGTEYYAAHVSVLGDIFEFLGLRPNQRYTSRELQEVLTRNRP